MCAMDVDETPNLRGRVCQLNYNCSGMLEPSPMAGLPKHVPFMKAPLLLRVGQTVCFRLVSRGDDVQAVVVSLESDVQPDQEGMAPKAITADASELHMSSTTSLEKTQLLDIGDVMSSVPAQSHSRCFLRRMNQFRNSDQAKQVQLVIEAERSLDNLLGQSTLDVDAICRLARKCASWLHPPVLKAANPQRKSAQMSARGTEDQVHLQERIRKILIDALNHLDLQDPFTFEAMKAALFYMVSLCQRLDEKCGFSSATVSTTPARKQWLELKGLLEESGLKSLVSGEISYQPPCPTVEDQSKPGPRPRAANAQSQMKVEVDDARIAAPDIENEPTQRRRTKEYYEPAATIKALSTVSEGTPVKLMCSECSFTITSSWYFENSRSLKRSVIAPRGGHLSCRPKVKNCYWKSLNNLRVIRGNQSELEFCPHKRRLAECKSCGGGKICIHAKRRHQCKECKRVGRRGPKNAGKVVSGDSPRERGSCATAITFCHPPEHKPVLLHGESDSTNLEN